MVLAAVTFAAVLVAGCGGPGRAPAARAGLSPLVRRIDALDSAYDRAHPGLVNCEATTFALLVKSYESMQQGAQGISSEAAAAEYGWKSAVATAYPPYYDALVSYVSRHGTQGTQAVNAVTGGTEGYVLRHGKLRHVSTPLARTCLMALNATRAASYPTPTPEARGPSGCPGSAALVAAWNTAPASAFKSQAIGFRLPISGFNGITCWQGWVLAYPIANANGYALFSEHGGLHMLSGAEMRQFNNVVCSAPGVPSAWKNQAQGPCP